MMAKIMISAAAVGLVAYAITSHEAAIGVVIGSYAVPLHAIWRRR